MSSAFWPILGWTFIWGGRHPHLLLCRYDLGNDHQPHRHPLQKVLAVFVITKAFMNILMIIGMFPGFMSMLAVYNILKGLGLNQSLFALVIVGAAGAAMGYHVCKGFFDTIPKALDEAAITDGANRWTIFTRIIIPPSKPIAIYSVLTGFLGTWSDYIFPSMLFGGNKANYTAAIGLKRMTDFRRIDEYYTQFAAGVVVVAVPIVIMFIYLQKYYDEGLSGAVKG